MSIFSGLTDHLYIFFVIVSEFRNTYLPDTSPLWDIWFANNFYYSLVCLFIFLTEFKVLKFLILIKSILSIFSFVTVLLVTRQTQGHQYLLLCFLLRFLTLTFRHTIYFELLCMVLGKGQISFFFIWTSGSLSTNY